MRSKNLIAVSALLVTAWASLATSSNKASLEQGTFYIISDCVSPSLEAVIRTANNQIISGGSFTDYGFPNTIVKIDSTNKGFISGVNRECVPTYGDTSSGDDFVFSCADNGTFMCSIVIKNY